MEESSQPILPQKTLTSKEAIVGGSELLLLSGKFLRAQALVDALAKQGVEIGGKNKKARISQLLSQDPRFKANRKKGWSLVKRTPKGDASDVDASEASVRH